MKPSSLSIIGLDVLGFVVVLGEGVKLVLIVLVFLNLTEGIVDRDIFGFGKILVDTELCVVEVDSVCVIPFLTCSLVVGLNASETTPCSGPDTLQQTSGRESYIQKRLFWSYI